MEITLLPADKSGCGLYRMMIPGREVAKSGTHNVQFAGGLMGRVVRDEYGLPSVWYVPPVDADVLVFQRPLDTIVAQLVPIVQAQGVAVVVELDDDVQHVDPGNTFRDAIDPRRNPLSNWRNVVTACRQADWVTVSTPSLRKYAPHGRVSVVPNTVPASTLSMAQRPLHSPPVVSWAGSVSTHPHDLRVVGTGVRDALRETGAVFQAVGDGAGVEKALQLDSVYPATGWVELPNYPGALRATTDVGIVPLAGTTFNRAKSWLKGLEYAAMGVPFVASPLHEYVRLADMGVGVLARHPTDWQREVSRFVLDDSYRDDTVSRWREIVAEKLVIACVVDRWASAWESARRYRDSYRSGRAAS